MSYIYGDRFGPEWALRHDGQKKTAPMGVAPDAVLRHVGTACRAALRRAVGWRRGVGGALAYPTRRAALRVFGAGARAVRRLGCRPVAAVARGGVGIFV